MKKPAATPQLTAERLREVLSYDAETGVFYWRVGRSGTGGKGSVAGRLTLNGYWAIRVDYRDYLAHRLAWFYVLGRWPKGHIDHRFGHILDNRISEIREASPKINSENRRQASVRSTSGLLGVERNGSRWVARICVEGARHYLGTFGTPEEAHEKYLDAKRKLHVGCTI